MSKRNANVAAILVAGGRGERFQTAEGLPKQFLLLEGEPIYIWSLKAFCHHPRVSKVVLVVLKEMLEKFKDGVRNHLSESTDKIVFAEGGMARQASVCAGLELLAKDAAPPKYVLVHDAVRPFVDRDDLDKVIDGVSEDCGCVLARPVSDTVKHVENEKVLKTIDRQGLFLMQTPQAAEFTTLLTAHRALAKKGIETTDDAAVLEEANVPVKVVIGSPRNFKITTHEDFYLAQALAARLRAEEKVRHYI